MVFANKSANKVIVYHVIQLIVINAKVHIYYLKEVAIMNAQKVLILIKIRV